VKWYEHVLRSSVHSKASVRWKRALSGLVFLLGVLTNKGIIKEKYNPKIPKNQKRQMKSGI